MGFVILMALLLGESSQALGYGLPFTGLAGREGVSKATSRDGKKGEAALHPEILTPIPNRQAGRVGVLNDPVQWKGKGCTEQAERDQRGRMLTVESIAEAVIP